MVQMKECIRMVNCTIMSRQMQASKNLNLIVLGRSNGFAQSLHKSTCWDLILNLWPVLWSYIVCWRMSSHFCVTPCPMSNVRCHPCPMPALAAPPLPQLAQEPLRLHLLLSIEPGGSHQQARTGGASAGRRINNPSARRINNPVAVARIINLAHDGDNGANPALTILAGGRGQRRHSITLATWTDRCRALLSSDMGRPLALLREGNHSLGFHSLQMPSTGHLWTGIDLNRPLFTPPLSQGLT